MEPSKADLDRAETYLSFTLAREVGPKLIADEARDLLADLGLLRAIAMMGVSVSRAQVMEKVQSLRVIRAMQAQAKKEGAKL